MFLVAVNFHGGVDLPRVDVHAVLPLLGEGHGQRHDVTRDLVRHVLGQLLLVHPVLVQRGHEVRQRPRHLELDLDGLRSKDEGVLMGQWNEAKQPRGLGWSPFSGGTIRQGNHHSLQILADNFEFTNRFKLHGLACKVFLWCDGVGEYIQQERGGAGSVHAKCNRVSDYRLKYHVN